MDQKETTVRSVKRAIERAVAGYEWKTVLALVDEGLALPELSPQDDYDLRDARVKANLYLGQFLARLADLEAMLALARRLEDNRLVAKVLGETAYTHTTLANRDEAQRCAQEALELATKSGDRKLQARAHNQLSELAYRSRDFQDLERESRLALDLAGEGVSPLDERWALRYLRFAPSLSTDPLGAAAYAKRSLQMARSAGDRLGELMTLNQIAIYSSDLADNLQYLRQAHKVATIIDNRDFQASIANNMAQFNWRVGLYRRAQLLAGESLRLRREQSRPSGLMTSLLTLASAAEDGGERQLARETYLEVYHLGKEFNLRSFEADSQAGLGRLAAREARLIEAEKLLSEAAAAYQDANLPGLQANTLAWLAIVYLTLDEPQRARETSRRATDILGQSGLPLSYSIVQDTWWLRYQVLVQTDAPEEASWEALDTARRALLKPLINIGDEGLRRNYLNKPLFNRAIGEAWVMEAMRRGQSLAAFTERETTPAALIERMERIVESGRRLAAERNPEGLAEVLLQEFIELSGVERAILALDGYATQEGAFREAPHQWAATEGIAESDTTAVAILAGPIIDQAALTKTPLLIDAAGVVPGEKIPHLFRRAALALPLISQGKVWGVLYGDMRHLFGRLNENDRDILSLLANQAGAALENANWVETLEQQVADRTAELNARVSELAIINSVQEGLAAELDLQAIFDIVGDKLTEIFTQGDVSLFTYDAVNDKALSRYFLDEGQRLSLPPLTPSPVWRYIDETRKPFLTRTRDDYPAGDEIPGTTPTKSGLHVPLIAGDRFIGAVNVQSTEENTFDESDLRLLTTLANSMSVALENARLFSEAEAAGAEAIQANEAKSAFMSNMSHELRTPLNAILGFTRIVRRKTRGKVEQRQTENLDKVLNSSEHLLGLINTILDIAKIEAGRMDVINTRFHIGQLIESSATISQPLLKPGVVLNLDIASDLPEMNSDQDKVKQILLNLLSNAAKFTHEGSITIRASVGAVREPPQLEIEVADTGIGMNEEQLGRVFEEFQQAESTTQRQYGGTGLGLSISKHLAQLLGGDLTAASIEGEGSTFTLVLPLEPQVSEGVD